MFIFENLLYFNMIILFLVPMQMDDFSLPGKFQYKLARYHCPVCSYSTDHSSNIRAHKRTHTGEKPFQCSVCLKFFSQKQNLKTHYRCHYRDNSYRCVICKKSFSQKVNLQSHVCDPFTDVS